MSFQEDEEEVAADRVIKPEPVCYVCFAGGLLVTFAMVALLLWLLTSCTLTLSFQNISTHGTASDLGDEDLQSKQDISPTTDLTIPLKPL